MYASGCRPGRPGGDLYSGPMTDERAGQPAQPADLVDVARLVTAYYALHPDPGEPGQRVAFGTSGHRGSSLNAAFNEDHILGDQPGHLRVPRGAGHRRAAVPGRRHPRAVRARAGARRWRCSRPTASTVLIDGRDGYTPTPAVSHAILTHNRGRTARPGRRRRGHARRTTRPATAASSTTRRTAARPTPTPPAWIQDRANELIAERPQAACGGSPTPRRWRADTTGRHDFLGAYVDDLPTVLDLDAIRAAGVRIGADPLGGASVAYWGAIAERHRLDLTVVNPLVDPTWRFMTLDWDGKIRMDCSSPYAMASLIDQRDAFDIATGNDADADRHGIVTPDGGLMNPNHYLAVAIAYLYPHRAGWPADAGVGKTLVSSGMIDRVAADLGRRLIEVPVGFKWFVPGLLDGSLGFGGEESAGRVVPAPRRLGVDHRQGRHHPGAAGRGDHRAHRPLAERALPGADRRSFGEPAYARVDAPATPEEKAVLGKLSADAGHRRHSSPASRSPPCSPRRPATAPPSAGSRSSTDERLVRRPAVRHRGRLQDLRRVLPGPGPPGDRCRRRPGPWSPRPWAEGGPDPGLLDPGLRAEAGPDASGREGATAGICGPGLTGGWRAAPGRLQVSSRGASWWTRVRPRSARRPAATPSP